MRENIFELIKGEKVELLKEYERLYELVENTDFLYGETIYTCISNNFSKWKYRGRYINITEFMRDMKIDYWSMIKDINMNKLFLYMEFLYNSLFYIGIQNLNMKAKDILHCIFDNMDSILEDLNYDKIKIDSDKVIITEKNSLTTAIAETRPDISNKTIEYRRFNMKGKIEEKKLILKELADTIEPLRKKFKATTYNTMMEDVFTLLNNLNIRHNNEKGEKQKEVLTSMTKEKLEEWYDKTYDMILGILVLDSYLDNKEEIKKLKEEL